MNYGIKTAIGRGASKLAPRHWYNYQQLRAFAESDFFGLHPPQSTTSRFLRSLLSLPIKNPQPFLYTGKMNSALKDTNKVDDVLQRLFHLGLSPHLDREKNWDAFRAFSFILAHGRKDSAVLDMGSACYGRILPWLHLYGLRDLHGCDISFEGPFRLGDIHYTRQDLQQTNYENARFDFITCLSVVEHGVNLDRFFREAGRLLKPGGYLLTSTDYWYVPVVSGNWYDDLYHCPVKVFTMEDIQALQRQAALHGFKPVDQIDYSCGDKLVHWERLDLSFTFLFLGFQRNLDISV